MKNIQEAWADRPLEHHQQLTDHDCSKTCLKMLTSGNRLDLHHVPSIIPTCDIPLYATRLGIYLEQQPVTKSGFTAGTYLILRRNHWFILRFSEDNQIVIHDPEKREETYMHPKQFDSLKLGDIACIFRVLWTIMP